MSFPSNNSNTLFWIEGRVCSNHCLPLSINNKCSPQLVEISIHKQVFPSLIITNIDRIGQAKTPFKHTHLATTTLKKEITFFLLKQLQKDTSYTKKKLIKPYFVQKKHQKPKHNKDSSFLTRKKTKTKTKTHK